VTGAPSSRKIISGLPHQCNFVSTTAPGVGVEATTVAVGFPPKLNHEHDPSSILDKSTQAKRDACLFKNKENQKGLRRSSIRTMDKKDRSTHMKHSLSTPAQQGPSVIMNVWHACNSHS
jgi:hypothetical protein